VSNQTTPMPFAEYPIDARVPEGLERLIADLRGRLPDHRLVEVEITGCAFERFETGADVRRGVPRDRRLGLRHVSSHARATACDLRSLTFVDEAGCKRVLLLGDLPGASSRRPFQEALSKYTGPLSSLSGARWPVAGEGARRRLRRGGFGGFYRGLEAHLLERAALGPPPCPAEGAGGTCEAGGPSLTNEEWFQLRAGVAARNALVDAGFVVYDPTTNTSHRDHFHFFVPSEARTWELLRCRGPDCDEARREAAIADDLGRAAGLE